MKNIPFKKLKSFFLCFLILSNIFFMSFSSIFGEEKIPTTSQGGAFCDSIKPSIRDSLLFSVITFCIVGVLEKIHEFLIIDCDRIVCKYEAIINNNYLDGYDLNFYEHKCDQLAGYQYCTYVVGEVFAIFDGLLDAMLGIINDLLEQGIVGLAFSIGTSLLRAYVGASCGNVEAMVLFGVAFKGECLTWALYPTLTYLIVIDTMAIYNTLTSLGDMIENFGNVESSCSYVIETISPELDNIINVYENKYEEEVEGEASAIENLIADI